MDEDYTPTYLASFLHDLPHLSFKFVLLKNQTFTLDDVDYLESLAMVALMPVVILVLTMIVFFIVYCCIRMKRAKPSKNNSSACYCSACLMVVVIMLSLGGICVGVYGSVQAHEGVTAASEATSDISRSFSMVTKDVGEINRYVDELEFLSQTLVEQQINDSDVDSLYESIVSLQSIVANLPNQDEGADDRLGWTVEFLMQTEYFRSLITLSLLGFHGFVCLFALLGICFRSKCLLITTTCIGLICLVVSYLYIGSFLMINVAVSDLCVDPYTFIKQQSVEKLYMDNATAVYYLKCSPEMRAFDPYKEVVGQANEAVGNVNKAIVDIGIRDQKLTDSADTILDQVHGETYKLSKVLTTLRNHLNCKNVHTALKEFVPAICDLTLEGLFVVTVDVFCVCIAFTIMLCAAPPTWRRYTKQDRGRELELDDVFLPTPSTRPAVSRTNNPMYNPPEDRFSGLVSSATRPPTATATNSLSFFRRSEEDVTLLDQPPPEYSPPRPGSTY